MAEVLQLQRGRGGKSISMQNSSEPLDACGAIDDHMKKSRERERSGEKVRPVTV